jgi:hypothetical protein
MEGHDKLLNMPVMAHNGVVLYGIPYVYNPETLEVLAFGEEDVARYLDNHHVYLESKPNGQ